MKRQLYQILSVLVLTLCDFGSCFTSKYPVGFTQFGKPVCSTINDQFGRMLARSFPYQVSVSSGSLNFTSKNDEGSERLINDDDIDDGLWATTQKVYSVLEHTKKELGEIKLDPPKSMDFQHQLVLFMTLLLVQNMKSQLKKPRDAFYLNSGSPFLPLAKEKQHLLELLDFSGLAYSKTNEIKEHLNSINYKLLWNIQTEEPGRIDYYIALNEEEKIAIVSVKGSSSFADFVTDACGLPVQYNLKEQFAEGSPTEISCHEGILDAAVHMVDDIQPLLEILLIPSGYKIILTGHSLGAGVSGAAGVILRSRIPKLKLGGTSSLEVVVFAPPPILNLEAARAASSFTTSIVHNVDVVPRASVNNAVNFFQFLDIIYARFKSKGVLLSSARAVLSLFLKWKNLNIISPEEIIIGLNKTLALDNITDMDHLYVPGNVTFLYDMTDVSTSMSQNRPTNVTKAIRIDNACPALRSIDIDRRMISDHMVVAYKEALTELET